MDSAVLPHLRRQYRASPAPRSGLQPGKFHAHAGDAEGNREVVADQPAREASQDWREGGQPRALRDLPAGRGRGAATDVRRNPVVDCPAAATARAGMREQRRQMPQAVTAEVRLDPAKSAHFSGSVPSNDRLAASTPAAGTIYDCPNPPKGKSLPEVAGNPTNVGLRLYRQRDHAQLDRAHPNLRRTTRRGAAPLCGLG